MREVGEWWGRYFEGHTKQIVPGPQNPVFLSSFIFLLLNKIFVPNIKHSLKLSFNDFTLRFFPHLLMNIKKFICVGNKLCLLTTSSTSKALYHEIILTEYHITSSNNNISWFCYFGLERWVTKREPHLENRTHNSVYEQAPVSSLQGCFGGKDRENIILF